MDEIYSDIGAFEKRLKYTGPIGGPLDDDSSEEEKPMDEIDKIQDKNRVLIEKLYKSQNQVKEYKEVIDTIQNGKDTDSKDK